MKKILFMSFLLMLTLLQQVTAQTRSISGRVTDRQTGDGIPGVTVLLKGTNNGVSTNSDGTFSLSNVPESGSVLVFSSVGFVPVERSVGAESQINIGLATDTKALSEVVVVGYGTQSKTLVTGAVTSVEARQFENQPVVGVDQVLQGRAAGVLVTQSSGTPGGGISVRIRGNNSISAGSDPLYVIDGVPINTGSYSNIGVGNQQLNALSDINPNDIESIEVLKDASAAAIYGSRAANGVVLVTTKRGKAGRTKVSFDYYTGVQQTIKRLDVLNGQESQDLINEARVNVGLAPRYVTANPTAAQSLFTGASTNWQDEIFRDARISNYSATVSGGDQKTHFLVSGTYFDQEGIIIGSKFNRGSGRLNLDHSLSDKVKVGTNLTISRSLSTRINNDNNIYGVLSGALLLGAQTPVYNPDGTYGRDVFSSVENPVASAVEPTFNARQGRIIGNFYAEVEPLKNLRIRNNIGIDYLNLKEDRFLPNTLVTASASNGAADANNRSDANWLNELTAAYSTTFADDHNVSGLIGFSAQRSVQEGIQASATNFPGNSVQSLVAGSVKVNASSDATSWTLLSYLARLNYDFRGKYILQGVVRRDGSSRFGGNNQYGYFPSVSGAWRVSEEAFLKDNAIVSELKLRAGYGQTGNFDIGNFASRSLFGVGVTGVPVGLGQAIQANYLQQAGTAPQQLANPDLTWEKTNELNAGIDVGLFDRFTFGVNLFQRKTNNLLLNRQLPLTSGFSTISQNIGSLENKGLEVEFSSDNIKSDDFSWTTTFNISFIRNKVTALVNNAPFLSGFANRVEVGQPLGAFYGYVVDRIYQNQDEISADIAMARQKTGNANAFYQGTSTTNQPRPGDIRFVDLNGDGVVTADDQKIIGSAQPNYFGGINNILSYKGIDLSFFFQFQQGNEIFSNTRAFGEGMNSQFGQLGSVRDRWTPTNTDTDIPRAAFNDPNNNRRTSNRFLEDGSYARLKTATLGYNLPSGIVKAARLQSARIYVSGQNLLTFTNYSGLDPEINTFSGSNTSLGTDFLTFPQARTFQVGVNLGL
ncbi:SusC/RagA family TonB-linked outer membrane protein [Hymenobacter metallicola]|uniref:TonB-dependent receptor n=1 Tax=Hymenobacter metallicola TaxID=2563114 RepID=A0A4Z0Q3N6_9BACT|nr:TonB-dependent receptor [Hymenobacter metallicola]TGE23342.1 TonB-dependent receptor [Hymenobacter metallicola]